MNVMHDPNYLSSRAAAFAEYERERDLSLKRNERNEYKEGEFERVRDSQRTDYAIAMGRAYAEFEAKEARLATAAAAAAPSSS